HAHGFRASDIGRRDVIDMAHGPAQTIDGLRLVHRLQSVEQVGYRRVVDHMLMDVPAGTRRYGRKLAVLAHNLGGPGILARGEVEKGSVEHLTQTEDAVLAVDLVWAGTRDQLRGFGRCSRVVRVELQGLPEPEWHRAFGRACCQEIRLTETVDA